VTATDLALVVGTVLCVIGFTAMVVVLLRMLRALGELRAEVTSLRDETRPLLAELRASVDTARDDLDRFDRVLGSAEAISSQVEGVSRVAKLALSTPIIKTVALASGTGRAARRLRGRDDVPEKRRAR
jgi:predicted RNA-binding Zn ribbon-like protein